MSQSIRPKATLWQKTWRTLIFVGLFRPLSMCLVFAGKIIASALVEK